ncbi:MAG TPA: glycosyltransferase [Tepidisphaeraceae bacterium]|nr:glycosyltransferase [Tepidisphaeraceae bacterium]
MGEAGVFFLEPPAHEAERARPHHFPTARRNALVPNPEWHDEALAGVKWDLVLCKTRHARELFAAAGQKTCYTGFTSEDCHDPAVAKDYSRWLHTAGTSVQKGTGTIIDAWAAHPEYPHLTITSFAHRLKKPLANVTVHNTRLADDQLRLLRNACGVHLCTSETEGWGHYLVEGMAAGALVVTTDAAPMNEHGRPARGVLCGYGRTSRQRLATNYHITGETLAAAVAQVLGMPDAEKAWRGAAARGYYQWATGSFREAFGQAVDALLQGR